LVPILGRSGAAVARSGHPERSGPDDRCVARATLEILAVAVYERCLAALGMTVDADDLSPCSLWLGESRSLFI